MNVEELLPDFFRQTLGGLQPPVDLANRIVDGLEAPRAVHAGGRHARVALAGVALMLAVALSLGLMARSGLVGPAGSFPESPSAAAILSHFDHDGIAFDYPASWSVILPGGEGIHDSLGTASGASVAPGRVRVTIVSDPLYSHPIDDADSVALQSGENYVKVGGLPAIHAEWTDGSTQVLKWSMSLPEEPTTRLLITATMVAPGLETMRAQVDALIAGLAYDPPAAVLSQADEARVARVVLDQLKASDPAFDCFSNTPGASVTGTTVYFPNTPPVAEPVAAVCATTMRPLDIGLWEITLSKAWHKDTLPMSGTYVVTFWATRDGVVLGEEVTSGEIPSWPDTPPPGP